MEKQTEYKRGSNESGEKNTTNRRPVGGWIFVCNQLAMDDKMQARILKYEQY